MRISDWSADVCSSDLAGRHLFCDGLYAARIALYRYWRTSHNGSRSTNALHAGDDGAGNDFLPRLLRRQSAGTARGNRSEEHTSELQSLMRISYAVFCLKKKKHNTVTRKIQTSKN